MAGPAIGTVDDLEDAIAALDEDSIRTWQHVEQASIRVYETVTGVEPGLLQVPGYERVDDLAVIIAEGDSIHISRAIRGVLEELPANQSLPPLLQTYLHGDSPPSPPLDLITQQQLAAVHVGQMGNTYPLSPNQRQTLHHVLDMCGHKSGQVLAVNGPFPARARPRYCRASWHRCGYNARWLELHLPSSSRRLRTTRRSRTSSTASQRRAP